MPPPLNPPVNTEGIMRKESQGAADPETAKALISTSAVAMALNDLF